MTLSTWSTNSRPGIVLSWTVVILTMLALFARGSVASIGETASSCPSKPEPIRIAVANFPMETCTFCPRPTDIKHFEHYGPPHQGEAVLEHTGGGTEGFVHAARDYCGVEVVGVYAVRWPVGSISGSWVTRRAFEKYANEIVERLAAVEDLDGIFLPLHGGMAVEGIDRPEPELIRRIRARLGDIPIAVVNDLHGNEDQALAEVSDIVLATKRFPHYDFNLMGERAARLLVRTIRGDFRPVMAVRKPGIMFATVFGGTHAGVPQDVMERARRWENQHLDTYVSVYWGFTFADVPDVGVGVFVLTNGDRALAERIADDMNDYIWENRDGFEEDIPGVQEGIEQALAAFRQRGGPVLLADMSDRMGDSTHILRDLLENGGKRIAVASLNDEKAVTTIHQRYREGDAVRITIGGNTSELAGEPIEVEGTVHRIGHLPITDVTPSPFAVVRFGQERGSYVLLTPTYHQVTTPEVLSTVGIPVGELDFILVKSRRHYRRGFVETGFVTADFIIDGPGHGPADISKLPFRHAPEGMYSKYLERRPGG